MEEEMVMRTMYLHLQTMLCPAGEGMSVMGVEMGCAGHPCSDHRAREGEEKSTISWECGDHEEVGRENGIGW